MVHVRHVLITKTKQNIDNYFSVSCTSTRVKIKSSVFLCYDKDEVGEVT